MKKILLPLTTLFLLSFLVIGVAQADVTVTVTTTPDTVVPGGSTLITVTSDNGAGGSITVNALGASYSKSITIPAGGGSVSVTFPDDFSGGANTTLIGEYEVFVELAGEVFKANFWVYFNVHVIPEIPLVGTAGTTVAMLSGLGLFIIKRRKPE